MTRLLKKDALPNHPGARRAMKARLAPHFALSEKEVEKRIQRAILTLAVQPDREQAWLRLRSNWPDYPKERLSARDEAWVRNEELSKPAPFEPEPGDISRYLDDLNWLAPLIPFEQDLIKWRAEGFAYRDIADRLKADQHMTEREVKHAYKVAISNCWLAAALTGNQETAA